MKQAYILRAYGGQQYYLYAVDDTTKRPREDQYVDRFDTFKAALEAAQHQGLDIIEAELNHPDKD